MTIRVRVLLNGIFRKIVGKREIIEEIDSNQTLKQILDKLANKYGRDFKEIVDPKTEVVSSEFLVSINGQIVRDTQVNLENDDILMITILTGGG